MPPIFYLIASMRKDITRRANFELLLFSATGRRLFRSGSVTNHHKLAHEDLSYYEPDFSHLTIS